jgi:hypothetical protein
MTTAAIEELADWEQHGGVAYPAKKVLRLKVIPKYLQDVGLVGWRRFTEVIPIGPGDRYTVLPAAMGTINDVRIGDTKLTYIGDNPAALNTILSQTSIVSVPRVYWVEFYQKPVLDAQDIVPTEFTDDTIAGPNGQRLLKIGTPSDRAYDMMVNGWQSPKFTDFTTAVNLDAFIPYDLQWGLIEGLKCEILKDRLGVGDPRSVNARAEYEGYVRQAKEYRDASAEETPRHG